VLGCQGPALVGHRQTVGRPLRARATSVPASGPLVSCRPSPSVPRAPSVTAPSHRPPAAFTPSRACARPNTLHQAICPEPIPTQAHASATGAMSTGQQNKTVQEDYCLKTFLCFARAFIRCLKGGAVQMSPYLLDDPPATATGVGVAAPVCGSPPIVAAQPQQIAPSLPPAQPAAGVAAWL
jgi:hypothetical protein